MRTPSSRNFRMDAKIKEFRRKAKHGQYETMIYRKCGFATDPQHLYPRKSYRQLLRESKDIDAEVRYQPRSLKPHGLHAPLGWTRFDARLNVARPWMARYRLLQSCDVRETGTNSISAHALTDRIVHSRFFDEKKLAARHLVPY